MDEARAPDKEKIKADYLKGIKPKELSDKYNISINTLKSWIKRYSWSKDATKEGAPHKQKGAPLNNVNAVGHGAPAKNDNAVKHGLFEKYLPRETLDIVNNMSLKPIDILWDQIQIAYAAIVRAQRIMEVTGKDEMIKELKKSKVKTSNRSTSKTNSESSEEEYEYEFQFAWDRQATFIQAQARAQSSLNGMIKQYEELCKSDLVTEEQKLRVSKLRYEVSQLSGGNDSNTGIKDFLKAVKPTEEDIKAMFTDNEVMEDAEEDKEE